MAAGVGLLFEILAKDNASPAFLRVAGAADKAATAAGRAQARVATAGAKMSKTGAMMTKRLSLPLLAIGAASVKAATDFNSSMTRIQTQAGASAKDVQVLTKAVLGMKNVQQGPNALAGALYHLKSVGLDNAGAMKALRASSDLAAVGNANLEETTNALAGAWRSGIKGAGSFAHTAATVNAIIGAGNMTLGDFTEGLSTGILPAARTFGVSLQSIGAALSVFTDEGVPANVALTRMRMTLSLLGAPTEKATKLLDGIGISSTQLAKDMRTGPNGLLNAVTDLKDHLSGLSKVAQAQFLSQAFGGGRSSSAIMTMLNQVGLLGQKWDQVTGSISKYGEAVRTQQATPQAQFKVALANLEKAGVLLGNQLLPIATQFAHAITGLATGFNSLSSGTKHFITEVGIGLLVLGPLVSLVGKAVKGIALMWAAGAASGRFLAGMRGAALAEGQVATKAYAAGSALRSVSKAGAAFVGLGIGYAFGKMAAGASTAQKAVATLGGTLSGALAGGLIAGGPGAAIGALTGLLGSLAGAFGGDNGAARRAAELAANVDALTATLKQDGNAVGQYTQAWVANKFATDGVMTLLPKLGVSLETATQAALGNKDAIKAVTAASKAHGDFLTNEGAAARVAAGEILGYSQALDGAKTQNRQEAKAAKAAAAAHWAQYNATHRNVEAVSRLAGGLQNATGATHANAGALHGEADAANAAGVSVRKLTHNLISYANAALAMAQSEDQFQESVRSLSRQLKGSHDQLNITTKAGLANRDAFISAATGALSLRDSQRKAGASIGEANSKLLDNIKQLRGTAIQGGATAGAVDHLLGRYHLLPRQIRTLIDADTSRAQAKLFDLTGKINGLVNGYHQVTISVVENDTRHGNTVNKARGGMIYGPGTSTSDSIPARLSNGEFVVRASQARKHQSLLHSINAGAQGFAAGGQAGSPITTTQSGGKKVWVYNGIQYASLMAAKNAETRDQQSKTNKYRLSGAPGVGGTTYSSRRAADNALAKAIKSLDQIFGKMSRHDLPNLQKALGKTGSDVRGAVSAWLQDAKSLGMGVKQRRSIAAEGRHLAQLVNRRDRDQARLKTLIGNRAAEKSAIGSAGRGIFDITQAGTNAAGTGVSFGALNAQALQDKKIVHKWAAGIRKLSKEFGGSPTGRSMVRQLAEGGPGDWPQVQALLSATPKQIAGLVATERDISSTSSALGGYLGGVDYGGQIKHQRAVVAKDIAADRQAYRELVKEMRRFMAHPIEVDVTLDGKKVGSGVAKGNRRNARRK